MVSIIKRNLAVFDGFHIENKKKQLYKEKTKYCGKAVKGLELSGRRSRLISEKGSRQ